MQYKVKLGLTEQQAYDDIYLFNQKGLILNDSERVSKLAAPYAKDSIKYTGKNIVSLIE